MTRGPWKIGGELNIREAEPEPAKVKELELPHRFRTRAGILGFARCEDYQKDGRGVLLA